MTSQRRVHRRPYFYEVFVLANLALIAALSSYPYLVVSIRETFPGLLPLFAVYTLAGLIARLAVAAYRRQLPLFWKTIRTAGWLSDTLRLIVFGAFTVHVYSWIKILVPLLHPRLYDQQLWDLDQMMLFGFSPNILFLDLFSDTTALKVIDWSYARIFFASMTLAFAFFLSSPSRRVRMAFTTGNAVMWIIGSWLYMLLPSLGPAFRFPDVWLPYSESLAITQHFQRILMHNYQSVLRIPSGGGENVELVLGVAAFPSLHVGFQTFAFLWMRRLWIYGEIVFGIFVLVILIGSVVTGWHYLIDGVAGILLALICYWAAARRFKLSRWLRLRSG
jgi:hypothetical protein